MTRSLVRGALLVLALLLVAGCGGNRLQKAGNAAVFDLQMETQLDWARIRAPRQEQWTIDGAPLNQLMILSRIKPREHVFLRAKERSWRPDGPWSGTIP